MTGRHLYDKYTDALKTRQHDRYDRSTATYVRAYPKELPLAWPFIGDDARAMWNTLAKSISPRKPK